MPKKKSKSDEKRKEKKSSKIKTKILPAKKADGKKHAAISIEAISFRAYFIAERRNLMGWPGDATSDWVEAERQLLAEAAKKK